MTDKCTIYIVYTIIYTLDVWQCIGLGVRGCLPDQNKWNDVAV